MHHAVAMGEGERSGDIGGDLSGAVRVKGALGVHDLGERSTVDELHDDEIGLELLPPVVDRDDVGMVEVRRGLSLAAEPLDEEFVTGVLGEEHLDGHRSVEQEVTGEVHVSHATAGELAVQFVTVVEHCRR